jgi:para-aminobenzoate synthetase/4-amino-4-deoxychorismate lyase
MAAESAGKAVTVRLDDLRPGRERSVSFGNPVELIVAGTPDQVPEVLLEAEALASSGRWVAGYVAYEAAPGLDPTLVTHRPDLALPLAWFAVFDQPPQVDGWDERGHYSLDDPKPDTDEASYADDLATIHQLIRHGDTYQVNYTFRLCSQFSGNLLSLYRDLVEAQRGGFGAFLDIGSHAILSASPELFFSIDGNRLVTRPMKGTAPRGRWSEEDHLFQAQLLASEKDRAENLMIVDLLRNDMGRISEYGSVEVGRLFEAEKYETVWQLTSTISSRLKAGTSLLDVFRSVFPSGSVTGAPKGRTMEIIRNLERSPRGVYCGAIGLLAPPGSGRPQGEFSVAIRTMVIDRRDGAAVYGIGGGITYDSTPEGEYAEAVGKARVLSTRHGDLRLLETLLREADGRYRRLQRHLDRIRSSAEYFGFPCSEEAVEEALSTIQGDEPLRVRITLDRHGRIGVEAGPVPASPDPLRLAVDDRPIDPSDPLLYHKTTRRDTYENAARRHPDADGVILVDPDRHVTETTTANLAVLMGGRWVTPPLSCGCLPGTYRSELLDHGVVVEAVVAVEDLAMSGGVAVFNSLRGWRLAVIDQC